MNRKILFAHKALNYFLAKMQQQFKFTRLVGKPYFILLDPFSACQLDCPFCGVGQRARDSLSFDNFEKIMDRLGRTCLKLCLYNWGEPALNKDLPKMIAYATNKYGIEVKISSNLNLDNDDFWREVARAGLKEMIVSLDGASEEIYKIYRVGGSFGRVIHNIKVLQDEKKKLKTRYPLLYWQFLVFKHNEHEIEKAREMAKELQMDKFDPSPPAIPSRAREQWCSTLPEYSNYVHCRFKDAGYPMCDWPWTSIVINANGSVSPCCGVQNEKDDFGNLLNQGRVQFKSVWNGPLYIEARKAIIKNQIDPNSANICLRCTTKGRINKAPLFKEILKFKVKEIFNL